MAENWRRVDWYIAAVGIGRSKWTPVGIGGSKWNDGGRKDRAAVGIGRAKSNGGECDPQSIQFPIHFTVHTATNHITTHYTVTVIIHTF